MPVFVFIIEPKYNLFLKYAKERTHPHLDLLCLSAADLKSQKVKDQSRKSYKYLYKKMKTNHVIL